MRLLEEFRLLAGLEAGAAPLLEAWGTVHSGQTGVAEALAPEGLVAAVFGGAAPRGRASRVNFVVEVRDGTRRVARAVVHVHSGGAVLRVLTW